MRCEDTLLFKDNEVAIKLDDENKLFKPGQIAHQIDEQKSSNYIEYGLMVTEKYSKIIKYVFYFKDYIKRKELGVKSAISIYTSRDFYNEYNEIYVLLNRNVDTSLEIQNVNDFALTAASILKKESRFNLALDLPKLFKKIREVKLEKNMEEDLLGETIRFQI